MIQPDELEVFYELPPIKRDKIIKCRKEKHKKEMRAALPVLTKDEIRMRRLPLHQAVLEELNEYGFVSTAHYIEELINYQAKSREGLTVENEAFHRPLLMESKETILHLAEGLKKAEIAYEKDFLKYYEELFHLGIHFSFGSSDWWWLGEQIVVLIVSTCDQLEDEHAELKALAAYVFGRYLLLQVKNYEPAMYFLSLARNISEGTKWNVKQFFPDIDVTLFVTSCYLLYKLLYHFAEIASTKEEALLYYMRAKTRSTEACYFEGIFECLSAKGSIMMEKSNYFEACIAFSNALHVATSIKNIQMICRGKLNLASALMSFGDSKQALFNLKTAKDLAEESDLLYFTARAYEFLGTYYLHRGRTRKATPLLKHAFKLFRETYPLEQETCRILVGACKGTENYLAYCLQISATTESTSELLKLVNWKESRQKFWPPRPADAESSDDEEDEFDKKRRQFDTALIADLLDLILKLVSHEVACGRKDVCILEKCKCPLPTFSTDFIEQIEEEEEDTGQIEKFDMIIDVNEEEEEEDDV